MADTSVKVSFIGDAKKLRNTLDDVDKDIDNLGKSSKSFGSKFSDGFSKAIPVLAGVGAGVAVLGNALKAAAEDEAEQKKLATTLMNVAAATQADVAATEKWIDAKQRATGVADSELRPALAVLVQGTKDLDTSTRLLNLAMDIAAGTGKPLAEVAEALSRAYAGNMRGLQALSPEMKTLIKDGMTADEAFKHLATTFKDQASVQAGTMEGKMARLRVSLDEAMESLGTKLMPVAIQFTNWLINDAIPKAEEIAAKIDAWWAKQDGLRDALVKASEMLVAFTENVITLVGWVGDAIEKIDQLAKKLNSLPDKVFGVPLGLPGSGDADSKRRQFEEQFGGGRASGGPVSAGGAYLVGERGPELLQMGGRSGNIVPNHALGGGGTVVLNIDGRSFMTWLVDYSRDAGGIPITTRSPS